jgi:hypothetical protein
MPKSRFPAFSTCGFFSLDIRNSLFDIGYFLESVMVAYANT